MATQPLPPGLAAYPARPGGQGSPDFVAQVDCSLALGSLDAAQIHVGGVEQPNAPADQLRHNMQYDLVDQPGVQRLPRDADAAGQQDVFAIRDRAGLLDGGLDAAGHECVAGAAALVDPLLERV
jgi:hypothetical protein